MLTESLIWLKKKKEDIQYCILVFLAKAWVKEVQRIKGLISKCLTLSGIFQLYKGGNHE